MLHTILIDGNNWGFAGMANPKLSSGSSDTQAIFTVINKVATVIRENPDANVIVLWDGRSWRNNIYSEYKANREKTEKDKEARQEYFEQKQKIIEGLSLLGIRQMHGTNMEADDLAYLISSKLSQQGNKVTLMTADKDWQQLVNENVRWVDNIHNRSCSAGDFEHITGFCDPRQFIEAKCILGDAGDNIKGITGIGPKALEGIYGLYEKFGSFIVALNTSREAVGAKWKRNYGKIMPKVLRELDVFAAHNKLKENLELVDLATLARPQIDKMVDKKGKLDVEAFTLFCHKNAFHSIIRRMDIFIKGFKDNKYVSR